ncbi:MAG: hypothetical protein ACLR0N_09425 [Bilophila wadsworthia]
MRKPREMLRPVSKKGNPPPRIGCGRGHRRSGDDWIIPDRNEHMAVDYSLFAGMGCLGRHRTVLLRGAVAYEDGKILDDARRGVFLRGSLPA